MAPRSKRARKAKDALPLRAKRAAVDGACDDASDVAPAAAHAEPPFDSNAEILPARPKRDKRDNGATAGGDGDGAPRKLTKSQARKARRAAEDRSAWAERAQVSVWGGEGWWWSSSSCKRQESEKDGVGWWAGKGERRNDP